MKWWLLPEIEGTQPNTVLRTRTWLFVRIVEKLYLVSPTGRGGLPGFASWLRPNEIWHCCPPFCNVLCTVDQQKQKSTRSRGVSSLSLSLSYSAAKERSGSLALSLSLHFCWRQLQLYCTEITRSQRNQLAFGDKADCWRSSFPPPTSLPNEWVTTGWKSGQDGK